MTQRTEVAERCIGMASMLNGGARLYVLAGNASSRADRDRYITQANNALREFSEKILALQEAIIKEAMGHE